MEHWIKLRFEKSGILRKNKPFVCGLRSAQLDQCTQLKSQIKKLKIPIFQLGVSFDYAWQDAARIRWQLIQGTQIISDLKLPDHLDRLDRLDHSNINPGFNFKLSAGCDFKLQNFSLAFQGFRILFPNFFKNKYRPDQTQTQTQTQTQIQNQYQKAIQKFKLLGRQVQIVKNQVQWVLDVAHNPASVAGFERFCFPIILNKNKNKIYAIVGGCQDKNWQAMIPSSFKQWIDHWYTLSLPQTRAYDGLVLSQQAFFSQVSVTGFQEIQILFENLEKKLKPGDQVFVYGSFYLIEKILNYL